MTEKTMIEESIFHEALARASRQEREAFLVQACGGDESLFSRVRGLLSAHDSPDAYLARQAGGQIKTLDYQPIQEQAGSAVGSYKLLEQIGEGGMGLVYMAEQQQPVRRLVALKLVKPGLDSKQVIARFAAEQQALAMMDHPNIAKVHDAGTSDTGRPYFVMELVRGIPINEFCDQQKLTVRQRLELFIQVCQAIQHAHQKGIIHRDLKPTNVLVTMNDVQPVPKVIDFGIAKALGQSLTDHTLHTGFTQLVGTPLYMSPEQAQMNQIGVDTRSDVYSLGVLLYELLTGTTPFDQERLKSVGFDEMRRIIREEEPETVSARIAKTKSQMRNAECEVRNGGSSGLFRRVFTPHSEFRAPHLAELDWIVMKALEKDRSRRYESASALAADIQRYLSDEPVLACPPTTMYRFHKFARKHKPALATAGAVTLCLVLGTTVSAWQAVRATTAEAEATANEQKAVANEQKANTNAAIAQEKEQDAITQRDEVKALADKLAAKEEELQQTLYANHIEMAQAAWDSGNVSRVTSLLNRHRPKPGEPDRRGFEWHYLNRRLSQIAPPLISIDTPMLRADGAPLSPDRTRLYNFTFTRSGSRARVGALLASGPLGPSGQNLHVWNLQTGQEELVAALPGASNRVYYSPDCSRVHSSTSRQDPATQAHSAGELKIWDTQTGKEILSRSGIIGIGRYSPDSKLLAAAWDDKSVKILDTGTGQERAKLPVQNDNFWNFSPDGKRLATAPAKGSDVGEIAIWDTQTGNKLLSLPARSTGFEYIDFSPDGPRLATVAAASGTIALWDSQTGQHLLSLKLDTESVYELTFSADGTRLIGVGDKEEQEESIQHAKLWNSQTGQEILSFRECELTFTPDGRRVAVADWEKSRTKLYDAQSGQLVMSLSDAGGKLAFSPDSKRLATRSGGMRIWDLQTGDEINHLKSFGGDSILAFSADSKRLIGGSQMKTQVWDVEAEEPRGQDLTLKGVSRQSGHGPGDSPAAFSADFTRLAAIAYEKIKIFDVKTGQELRTLAGHDNNVMCVAISADGKRVASSDGRRLSSFTQMGPIPGVVTVWDAESGSELFTIAGHDSPVTQLAFSPDGKTLAGGTVDRRVKLWDAQSGRERLTVGAKIERPNAFAIPSLAFSPDGKRLASGGKIWDTETGEEQLTLKGGGSMLFSPDGKHILAGSGSPAAGVSSGHAIYDAQTGEPLNTIGIGGLDWVAFSPDGKRVANARGIWDAQTGQLLLNLHTSTTSGQIAFSPDGHRLGVVRAFGNEVAIYDATPLPEKP